MFCLFKTFCGLIFEIGFGGVVYNALDAVEASAFGVVNFRSSDDLAVARFEVEFETGLCLFDYEFSHF
jgi:hypothetical protein